MGFDHLPRDVAAIRQCERRHLVQARGRQSVIPGFCASQSQIPKIIQEMPTPGTSSPRLRRSRTSMCTSGSATWSRATGGTTFGYRKALQLITSYVLQSNIKNYQSKYHQHDGNTVACIISDSTNRVSQGVDPYDKSSTEVTYLISFKIDQFFIKPHLSQFVTS